MTRFSLMKAVSDPTLASEPVVVGGHASNPRFARFCRAHGWTDPSAFVLPAKVSADG